MTTLLIQIAVVQNSSWFQAAVFHCPSAAHNLSSAAAVVVSISATIMKIDGAHEKQRIKLESIAVEQVEQECGRL